MTTPPTRTPDSASGVLALVLIAVLATLPLGGAAPAWRDLICSVAGLAAGIVLLPGRGPVPALSRTQAAGVVLAGLTLLLHAGLALAGAFPDATAVFEAMAFRTGLVVFAVAAWTRVSGPSARRAVAAGAATTALFQVLAGLLLLGSGGTHAQAAFNRLQGTFTSGNSLGGFLALTVPLLAGWLPRMIRDRGLTARRLAADLHDGSIRRTLPVMALIASLLVSLAGLILSGSRGAMTAAAAGVLLALAPAMRAATRRRWLVLVCGMVAATAAIFMSGGRFDTAASRWEQATSAGALQVLGGRRAIWTSLAPLLVTHPRGVGMGGLRVVAHLVQPDTPGSLRLLEAHCDPYELVLETGLLPGLILLAALLALIVPALAECARGGPGLRAGMAGAVLAGGLHSLGDFNLLWRPGVSLWFLLCLGGILPVKQPVASTRRRRLLPATALLAGAFSLLYAAGHFRAEWLWEKSGGRRSPAMTWLKEPVGRAASMAVPALNGMTADAAARCAAAWLRLRDHEDGLALSAARETWAGDVPVTGSFYARQFRWSESAMDYRRLADELRGLLAGAPGNADLRLMHDTAALRAWLGSHTGRPAPALPENPAEVSRLHRIRAAYAAIWFNLARTRHEALPAARRWLESLPEKHPSRLLLERENRDMLTP